MNSFFLVAILSSSLSALASNYQPEAIFNSLTVKAVHVNAGIAGVGKFEKSVGGLSCTKETVIVPNAVPTYTCFLDSQKENAAEIYNALNVEAEQLNPGIAGVGKFEKSVGGLSCTKETIVVPNAKPTYSCASKN